MDEWFGSDISYWRLYRHEGLMNYEMTLCNKQLECSTFHTNIGISREKLFLVCTQLMELQNIY